MANKIQPLSLETLSAATTSSGTAFRLRVRLQPVGGQGDKVFPPTYAEGQDSKKQETKYAFEERVINGERKPTVLLDSVASQANRMELALLDARERSSITLPLVGVDFSAEFPDLGRISSLEAPHRVYDAILRDSTLDGDAFRASGLGRRLTDASPADARAMFEHCPTALIFGAWDSTGPRGGMGNKFQRAVVSEVVGIDFVDGAKVGSRLDPLGAAAKASLNVPKADKNAWELASKGKGKPSDVNHGNIPPSIDREAGGVTFDYGLHTAVLSLPALRRLRFGDWGDDKSNAARVVLAALGLVAITLQRRAGYDFRSRCTLVPEAASAIELVSTEGEATAYSLSVDDALALLAAAQKEAAAVGVTWAEQEVRLDPMPKLVQLIAASRELHAAGNAGED